MEERLTSPPPGPDSDREKNFQKGTSTILSGLMSGESKRCCFINLSQLTSHPLRDESAKETRKKSQSQWSLTKSDQYLNSPYNITPESHIKVTRIREMITN